MGAFSLDLKMGVCFSDGDRKIIPQEGGLDSSAFYSAF